MTTRCKQINLCRKERRVPDRQSTEVEVEVKVELTIAGNYVTTTVNKNSGGPVGRAGAVPLLYGFARRIKEEGGRAHRGRGVDHPRHGEREACRCVIRI